MSAKFFWTAPFSSSYLFYIQFFILRKRFFSSFLQGVNSPPPPLSGSITKNKIYFLCDSSLMVVVDLENKSCNNFSTKLVFGKSNDNKIICKPIKTFFSSNVNSINPLFLHNFFVIIILVHLLGACSVLLLDQFI